MARASSVRHHDDHDRARRAAARRGAARRAGTRARLLLAAGAAFAVVAVRLTTDRSGVAAGSGQREPYPATPTWTFYGSSYASRYLAFTPVETSSSVPDPATGGYTPLQTLTAAQQATLARYDAGNAIPFIDIGNRYVEMSVLSPYGPQGLAGKSWAQVAAAVRDPSSALGREIDASANYLTAAICTLTGNSPASACTRAIRLLQPRLG